MSRLQRAHSPQGEFSRADHNPLAAQGTLTGTKLSQHTAYMAATGTKLSQHTAYMSSTGTKLSQHTAYMSSTGTKLSQHREKRPFRPF